MFSYICKILEVCVLFCINASQVALTAKNPPASAGA